MKYLTKIALDIVINSLIIGAWVVYGIAWPSYIMASILMFGGLIIWSLILRKKQVPVNRSPWFYLEISITTVFIALYAHFGLMFMAISTTLVTAALLYLVYKK